MKNIIIINPSTITRVLIIAALSLIIASLLGQMSKYLAGHGSLYGFVRLFDIDRERNIPTFFSVCLLSCSALLLSVISVLEKKRCGADVLKWMILALGFLYIAVDESWLLHEELIEPIRKGLGDSVHGVFHFAWVIPAIAVVLILGLFFWGFLSRLPAKIRFKFLIAAFLYIGGSIGMEIVGGWYVSIVGSEKNLTYSMLVTIEEGLEMGGVILFINALLIYIMDNFGEVRFGFSALE